MSFVALATSPTPFLRFSRCFFATSALSALLLVPGACAPTPTENTSLIEAIKQIPPPQPTGAPARETGWRVETVAEGINQPWGIAWLPDGRAIVTAKRGTVHVLNGDSFEELPLEGMPPIFSGGQGALMDIMLHPNFATNKWIYMTVSTGTSRANRTTLVRGVFDNDRVRDIQVLFQVDPDKSGGQHFGSRLLWLPDGTLLMSIGDGGNAPARIGDRLAREQAQNLATHQGSVLRLTEEGKPAPNNPFVNEAGAKPELWTIGHRNIQGMARDPDSGLIWATEHGPQGGDELNILAPGLNYGWPITGFGGVYGSGEPIGVPSAEGMINPKIAWVPSPAPCGLAFYTGSHFPQWRGSLFSGGLAGQDIRRVALDTNGNVTGQSRLRMGARIRDVKQGPDGYLYAITDESNGRLLRIMPEG